jgi:tetratricopeptide (TPR) repeat protein
MFAPFVSSSIRYSRQQAVSAFAAIIIAGAVLSPPEVEATEKCAPLASSKDRVSHLQSLINDKAYSALEDELGARLLRIDNGTESDVTLWNDMIATFTGSPAMEPLLTGWVAAYPKSYLARMARARHFYALGFQKRGSAFADKTTEEQFNAMRQEFIKSTADLQAAVALNNKPTLAYAQSIAVAASISEHELVAKLIQEAETKFPKSLAIRSVAAAYSHPKWGGSLEELDQIASSAAAAGMGAADLRFVNYRVEMEKGNYYEVVTKQNGRAVEHYRSAGNICESENPWRYSIRLSRQIEDWPVLLETSNRLLEIVPSDTSGLENRGWALEKSNRIKDAMPDYVAAAELGSSWALNKAGWLYWRGESVTKDVPRARRYFEQAAAKGNQTAIANLAGLNAEQKDK